MYVGCGAKSGVRADARPPGPGGACSFNAYTLWQWRGSIPTAATNWQNPCTCAFVTDNAGFVVGFRESVSANPVWITRPFWLQQKTRSPPHTQPSSVLHGGFSESQQRSFRGGGNARRAHVGPDGLDAPANTGGSLAASVTGGTPMLAPTPRHERVHSYARVLHPRGAGAAGQEDTKNKEPTLGKPGGDLLVETEMLYSGRVTFILGRRAQTYADSPPTTLGLTMQRRWRPSTRVSAKLHPICRRRRRSAHDAAPVLFEYLERYFTTSFAQGHHWQRDPVVLPMPLKKYAVGWLPRHSTTSTARRSSLHCSSV